MDPRLPPIVMPRDELEDLLLNAERAERRGLLIGFAGGLGIGLAPWVPDIIRWLVRLWA